MRIDNVWPMVAIAVLGLTLTSLTFAQGRGEPPEGMNTREKVDWAISELGSSSDELTVRDSIDRTDDAVLALAQLVVADDSSSSIEELREQLESATATPNVTQEAAYWFGGLITALFVLVLGQLIRLSAKVGRLEGAQDGS
ncbi:MAG: hypothetical protein F4149_18575 [Gammaproteobacteria bacterium]|nr:hypothetical protein [Gammaproteobacteria bacterium]MYK82848.1 hypothetical protein [Gammaproteobacteria bacterium]